MKQEYPYKECETCKTLEDCPHPSVSDDLYGTPIPPPNCPKPKEVMEATKKKRDVFKETIKRNQERNS